MMDLKIIDAHFHFWEIQAQRHPWLCGAVEKDFFLGDYSGLMRDYLPADYRRDSVGLEVVKLVHCEAEWDRNDQVGETQWLTALNAASGWPTAAVGHAWLDDPALADILAAHCRSPLLRGIRSKPVTAPAADAAAPDGRRSLQDPNWRRGYRQLADFGLSYDLRVPCWHLAEAAAVIEAHPDIPVVVNHLGFPWDRSAEGLALWRQQMTAIARLPWVHLKVSELGLKDQPWEIDSNRRVVLEALDIFGVERCMWASNFPVAGLRIGYGDLVAAMLDIFSDLTNAKIQAVFHDNANRFYRL
jgi:predicted TIM-barrel fold metal-dependent hydrolase